MKTDIVTVVGDTVKLTRRGRNHVGLCPFHKEETPSFHVNMETGRYYCFSCHEKGTAVDFIMKRDGLTFQEAVRVLTARDGLKQEFEEEPKKYGGEP